MFFLLGLINLTNTCFVNALLQCLISSSSVASCIHDEYTLATDGKVLAQLKRVHQQLRALKKTFKPIDITTGLFKVLQTTKSTARFTDKEKHCPCELLDILLGGSLSTPPVRSGKRRNAASSVQGVSDVFAGTTQHLYQCASSSCSIRLNEPVLFRTLQLPGFVEDQSPITLEQLFANLMAPEFLAGFKCPHCNCTNTTTRTTSFATAPQNLVVHLNRMDENNEKQFRPVVFPLVFDLPDSSVTASSVPASYCLVAVARHRSVDIGEGIQGGSHFVAHVREQGGSWWLCNDTSVAKLQSSCSPDDPGSIEDTPYLLFYERRGVGEGGLAAT
jgi:ubiquitin C-terminal hydrolase